MTCVPGGDLCRPAFKPFFNVLTQMDYRCKECFAKNYEILLKKIPLSIDNSLLFSEYFNGLLNESETKTSPEIQRELHYKLRELNNTPDPYLEEKIKCNKIAMSLYEEWKPRIQVSENPFDLALRLAIAGNIMDYGASHQFDLEKTISKALVADFAIGSSSSLKRRISEAQKVLFLGDNAGEIVFDKLFIETIMHPDVTYAVKEKAIINDATFQDAIEVGMHKVADIITNGYDAPSTILGKCSEDFLNIYHSADLIISKGQGNLEGLLDESDPRIIFLFMVKCDVISERIAAEKGSFVILN